MTTLPGNPHFTEGLLDSPDERSTPSMLAAVAHELRTASLLKFAEVMAHGLLNDATQADLRARLGLTERDTHG